MSQEQKHLKKRYQKTAVAKKYIKKRFTDPVWQAEHDVQIKTINNFLKQQEPNLVLNLACGPGRITQDLKHVNRGVAADISGAMLAEASRRLDHKKWKLKKVDAFNLPFPNNHFDAVISFRFIRHFRQTDRNKLLAEINRVLKPEGVLIFDALNKNMQRNYYFEKFTVAFRPEAQGFFDALWTIDSLHQELEYNHLTITKIISIINHPNLYVKLQKIFLKQLSKKIIERLDYFKTKHNFEWIIMCKK